MNIKLIIAIFPRDKLEAVEKKLQSSGLSASTFQRSKGTENIAITTHGIGWSTKSSSTFLPGQTRWTL